MSNTDTGFRYIRNKANQICKKYSGYKRPSEIRNLWFELEQLGIDIGTIDGYPQKESNGTKTWTKRFEYKGKPVENSLFIYSVYEGDIKNDYNIYFS